MAMLGVAPAAGRVFLPEENAPGRDNAVVPGDSLWRMALGAQPASVLKLVLREGLIVGLAGVALGLAATLAVVHLLAGLLYEVPAFDPATFLGASILLMAVVLAACYIPARRASRLDPMIALRWE